LALAVQAVDDGHAGISRSFAFMEKSIEKENYTLEGENPHTEEKQVIRLRQIWLRGCDMLARLEADVIPLRVIIYIVLY
jgi:hypothetical protein